jgi:hypothetical protein
MREENMKKIEFIENITLDTDMNLFQLRKWDPFQLSRVLLNVPMDAQKLREIRNWKKKLFKKSKKDFINDRQSSPLKWETK